MAGVDPIQLPVERASSRLAFLHGWQHFEIMQTVTLPEAQRRLTELVRDLAIQGDLVITDADKPIAKLSFLSSRPSLKELQPRSVGAILRPYPSADDDLLGEMQDPWP